MQESSGASYQIYLLLFAQVRKPPHYGKCICSWCWNLSGGTILELQFTQQHGFAVSLLVQTRHS
jgi:hypothetical protein